MKKKLMLFGVSGGIDFVLGLSVSKHSTTYPAFTNYQSKCMWNLKGKSVLAKSLSLANIL